MGGRSFTITRRGIPSSRFASTRRFLPVLAALAVAACNPGAGKTAYVGAEVFDGSGAPLLLDAVIVVSGGRIEAIGPPDAVSVPRGAREVRLDGQWVIPGLIDAHTHAERWMLPRFLAYGVTSIRDVGGTRDSVILLRDDAALGAILGPRMFVAGAVIDGAPATRSNAVEAQRGSEARRAIDELVLLDADYAKIYTKIDEPLLVALMEEANTLQLPVTGHLGKVDALTAAQLGIRALEHMSGVVEASVPDPTPIYRAHDDFFRGWNLTERSWASVDSAALDATARSLAGADVAIVPTLALHEAYSRLTDREFIQGLDLTGVPDSVRRAWDLPDLVRRARLGVEDFIALRRARRGQDRFVRMFRREGGLIAAGSDTPNQLLAPGASLHDELALLVAAGLTARDALLAATGNVATLLGADSIGVLRPGALADFVVLQANPLQDIRHTRGVDLVVLRGIEYRPRELRQRW